jgi:hypothetical protein
MPTILNVINMIVDDVRPDPVESAFVVVRIGLQNINKNMIGGDLNVGDIDWKKGLIKDESRKKSVCQQLLDILLEACLTQIQKEPSCQDQVLDLLCISNLSLMKSILTVLGISDLMA